MKLHVSANTLRDSGLNGEKMFLFAKCFGLGEANVRCSVADETGLLWETRQIPGYSIFNDRFFVEIRSE